MSKRKSRDRGLNYDASSGFGFLPKSQAVVETTMPPRQPTNAGAPHTTPKKDDKEEVSDRWAFWGKNNDEPQKITDEAYKVGVATSGLGWKERAHYGRGVRVYKEEWEDNDYVLNQVDYKSEYPEINEFFKRIHINHYMREMLTDYHWFWNTFPEIVLTRDFSKVYSIQHLEASFCRWGLVKKGDSLQFINKCGYSAKWPDATSNDIEEIPVVSPLWTPDEIREYCRHNKIYKFIYPTYNPTPGKTYYQQAYWDAARQAGWLDVAASIPTFKKHLMENQMKPKWHIKIPEKYWLQKFPEPEYSEEQRQTEMESVLTNMDEWLAGTKNAGKAFISHFAVDKVTGKELPGWSIEALKGESMSGEYLTDLSAANDEILFAMGIDPTLIGHGAPGSKMGAGSGSDKYRAYSIYIALASFDRDITMEPLHFVRDFNGWDENLVFGFANVELTTIAEDQTGQQEQTPSNSGAN